MVIAQYTGVSLQRDDRAFIRYDEYANTWNQASLVDAFATVPYHAKGDSYWKDDWRNFHVRATEDAFIQNVSIFAVGFACLLYTSPSPRDKRQSRMPSSA